MDNENGIVEETLEESATPEEKTTYTQEEVLALLQKETEETLINFTMNILQIMQSKK